MMNNLRRPLTLTGLTLCIGATALLGGCSTSMIPTGYTYHNKPYKSPPAPLPKKLERGERNASAAPSMAPAAPGPVDVSAPLPQPRMAPEQADQFRMAIYQLAENLTRRAGVPPKTVYVMQPSPSSEFYDMMDRDVREALRHLNYRLSDTPDNSYVITYAAQPVSGDMSGTGDRAANVRVSLLVYNASGPDAKLLTEESNSYYIEGAEGFGIGPASPGPVSSMPLPSPSPSPSPSPVMPPPPVTPAPARLAPIRERVSHPVPMPAPMPSAATATEQR